MSYTSGMTQIEIAGQTYNVTSCSDCTDGKAFDITNLDNASGTVSADGSTRCDSCCGCGEVYKLPTPKCVEYVKAEQEIGEMPDWMF